MMYLRINDILKSILSAEYHGMLDSVPIAYTYGNLPRENDAMSFSMPAIDGFPKMFAMDINGFRGIDFTRDQFLNVLRDGIDSKPDVEETYFADTMSKAYEYGVKRGPLKLIFRVDPRKLRPLDRPYTYEVPRPDECPVQWMILFDKSTSCETSMGEVLAHIVSLFT